jgi:MYXO-CTERM domain-containing protein
MKYKRLPLPIIAGVLFPSILSAAVIGVDLSGTPVTTIGVLDTTSRTWEGPGTFTLDGMSVTVSVTNSQADGSSGNPALPIFQNYRHNNGSNSNLLEVTISGLNNAQTYNLAIFMAQVYYDRGGTATITTVNTTPPSSKETNPTSNGFAQYTEGNPGNYVRFDDLPTDGSGNITFEVTNGPEGVGILNGFEIQNVPEPSSAGWLLSLLLLGAGFSRRR